MQVREIVGVLLLFVLSTAFGQSNQVPPCFQLFAADASVQPLTNIYGTNLYDCMSTCLQTTGNFGDACQSVIWDEPERSCYLFNQRASQNPTILFGRKGTAYYEKNSQNCETGAVGGGGYGGGGIVAPPITGSPPIITNGPFIPSVPSTSGCARHDSIAYFTVAEAEQATQDTATSLTGQSENVCIDACSDEINPNGGGLPCAAVTSLPKDNKCFVTTVKSEPTGTAFLVANPDAVYFEKFCLPDAAPSECFEQFFFLFPRKTFSGHDLSTAKATSLSDCAGRCVLQGGCRSAVFDAASSDCVLKSESALTAPADFIDGTSNTYYFENGCLINANRTSNGKKLAHANLRARFRTLFSAAKSTDGGLFSSPSPPANWGPWSACQFKVGNRRSRIRTRNCKSLTKCADSDIEFDVCSQ